MNFIEVTRSSDNEKFVVNADKILHIVNSDTNGYYRVSRIVYCLQDGDDCCYVDVIETIYEIMALCGKYIEKA